MSRFFRPTTYPTSDGTCIRDYIHVGRSGRPAAPGRPLDHLLAGGATNQFNVGTGRGNTVMEVLKSRGTSERPDCPPTKSPPAAKATSPVSGREFAKASTHSKLETRSAATLPKSFRDRLELLSQKWGRFPTCPLESDIIPEHDRASAASSECSTNPGKVFRRRGRKGPAGIAPVLIGIIIGLGLRLFNGHPHRLGSKTIRQSLAKSSRTADLTPEQA